MNRTKRFASWASGLAMVTGLIAGAAPSQAYRMWQYTAGTGRTDFATALVTCTDPNGFAHWADSNVNIYHNTSGPGSGKAAALFNAMSSWNFVSNATQSLTYAGTTTAGFITDGISSVSWGTGNGCSGNCLAITAIVLQAGQVIQEADVSLRSDLTWTTNGSNFDVQAVATHEFGHTLGIHHSDVSGATMFQGYTNQWSSLETDDKSALQCSYNRYTPTSTCIPDGGVDDSGGSTSCCSGLAITGITYCPSGGDCSQICATPLVGGCVPSGGIDDTLSRTSCCSGAAVPGSTRCLNPADWNNGWSSCIQTCQ